MLFDDWFEAPDAGQRVALGPQSCVLRGHALPQAAALLAALDAVQRAAPPRRMQTPGGHTMSVALSNCGTLGWTSGPAGYRYTREDPATGRPWPAIPPVLLDLARAAAAEAGFPGFVPDACLVNDYAPGARMSLHQDRNECDLAHPIVSVSLGIPAVFLFGGMRRTDPALRIPLFHGDVAVWGGTDRLRYHGVLPVAQAEHPVVGRRRLNITFRRAGR
ncbi:DNA oxidative demethylase AlkB [Bordetella sp. 2513F-2]